MANKIVALFVEGPTEIEFYKAVVKYAHDIMNTRFSCTFEWINMNGIGNYKSEALRKFKNLQQKNPNSEIVAMLCIDTDVFDFSKKPPINKAKVKNALKDAGAKTIYYIEAKESIEDWFLEDLEGIINYLHLPKGTRRPPGKGQDALKALFRNARKIYVKGGKTEGLIEKLDISKIIKARCKAIKPLCMEIGFDCSKVCGQQVH